MTRDEDRTHFTLWCMMNSPLLAGNDLRTMTPETIAILTHPEIIALNQDPLAYQARRLRDDGDSELWAKPLGKTDSGDVAVTLLNRGKESATISFNLAEIGIDAGAGYAIRDLWQRKTLAQADRPPARASPFRPTAWSPCGSRENPPRLRCLPRRPPHHETRLLPMSAMPPATMILRMSPSSTSGPSACGAKATTSSSASPTDRPPWATAPTASPASKPTSSATSATSAGRCSASATTWPAAKHPVAISQRWTTPSAGASPCATTASSFQRRRAHGSTRKWRRNSGRVCRSSLSTITSTVASPAVPGATICSSRQSRIITPAT